MKETKHGRRVIKKPKKGLPAPPPAPPFPLPPISKPEPKVKKMVCEICNHRRVCKIKSSYPKLAPLGLVCHNFERE